MWQRQKPDRCVNMMLCKAYSILQPKMSTNKHCHTYQEGQPCLNKWLGFWTDRSKEERVLKQRPEESYSEGDSTLINPKTNEKSDVLNLIHSIITSIRIVFFNGCERPFMGSVIQIFLFIYILKIHVAIMDVNIFYRCFYLLHFGETCKQMK